MKTKLIKRLVVSTWTALSIAGLLLIAAWIGTHFEPSVEGRRAELARFEAMPAHGDWKPTALSLIKSRQEVVHVGITALRAVMGVSVVFALLSVVNIVWLRRLARSNHDTSAA